MKPRITDQANPEIKRYGVEVASQRSAVRIKNVVERLTKAIAKLNFKNIADNRPSGVLSVECLRDDGMGDSDARVIVGGETKTCDVIVFNS